MMVTCQRCGDEFTAQKSTAKFCSASCRVAWHRASAKPGGVVSLDSRRKAERLQPAASVEDVTSAVRAELGDQVSTALGQQALLLARRLDSGQDPSGAAVASLSKQLVDVMARVYDKAGASGEVDPLAEIQRSALEVRRRFARGA